MNDGPAPDAGATHGKLGTAATVAIAVAVSAAAIRLITLHFLHPLNWDELEFFRATRWIAEGRVPFRDFWEHHTPLAWFLFAPVTWLSRSGGVDAVIALRWAQVPVWIATFFLANLWMRGFGLERFARFAAIGFALTSSLFMLPAVEYRVDSVGCLLVMGGLVLAQRQLYFWSGAVLCLAGFANLRLGPVLVVAVLLIRLTGRSKANSIFAGGFAALLACLSYFAATGSLDELVQQVWFDNLAEKFATPIVGGFVHRLLLPFGVRLIASDRLFELAAVDVGGIVVLLAGTAGLMLSLRRWGTADGLFVLGVIQLTNVLFIASMKFVYNYHFELVVILAVPMIAFGIQNMAAHRAVLALLLVAFSVNSFAAVFRGKELDRAYQDLVMRQIHQRTLPDEQVWSGAAWGIHRAPAYRFWFLPELARQLVLHGHDPRYEVREPPAAVVFDHNALVWITHVQRELGPYFVRHYIPVWRELLIPAMNARLAPGGRHEWIVPRTGEYRVHVSARLVRHPWFRDPIGVVATRSADAARLTVTLGNPEADERLTWSVDGRVITSTARVAFRRGQRVAVTSQANEWLAVILLSSDDRLLFRQPPPGATLEAETTRVTHVPQLGLRIDP